MLNYWLGSKWISCTTREQYDSHVDTATIPIIACHTISPAHISNHHLSSHYLGREITSCQVTKCPAIRQIIFWAWKLKWSSTGWQIDRNKAALHINNCRQDRIAGVFSSGVSCVIYHSSPSYTKFINHVIMHATFQFWAWGSARASKDQPE